VTGAPRFIDTNVLLYSISRDRGETEKRERAIAILDAGGIVLSVQVLQEFYVQATRATRQDRLAHDLAVGLVRAWRRFPVVELTAELMDTAFEITARHRLSFWDAAIVAAAASVGCAELLSEDLNHGQTLAGVRVTDPFR
jgi:predicted nucleic acid-binding protein